MAKGKSKSKSKSKKTKKISLAVIVLVVILVVAYFVLPQELIDSVFGGQDSLPSPTPSVTIPLDEGELKIHFVDVGQGDSIIIQLPDGKNMIIDGGDKKTVNYEQINAVATELGIKKFDYCILTHSDADHVGGLDDVLEDFDVVDFYVPKVSAVQHDTVAYKDFLELMDAELKQNKGTLNYSLEGMKIEGEGYCFDFYSPTQEYYDSLPNKELTSHQRNAVSPIIVLTFDGRKVMFTGDTNTINEEVFNEKYVGRADLDVDVLKVAHHGSTEASSTSFLEITKPEFSVIMCGAGNTYGHPHDGALDRLNTAKSQIYRTDLNGNITLTLDAKGDGDATMKFDLQKAS